MKDTTGKSEHEIMLERLQKWREEKGKPSASKHQPVPKKRPVKSLGAVKPLCFANAVSADGGKKKPLQSFNSSSEVQGAISRKLQGNQSVTKKPPVQKARHSAPPCRQEKSPETPMSKRLELWRAQKQKKSASKSSATKPPWKGSGTPAMKKQTPKSTHPSTGKDVSTGKHAQHQSAQKEAMHSGQRENRLSQNRSSTCKMSRQGDKDEQGNMQNEDVLVPVPPTNLSSAFDENEDNDDAIEMDYGDVDVNDCQNSLSRTETPVMNENDDDLVMNSSCEDEGLISQQTDSEVVVEQSSQSRKRKTPDRTYKSAFAQNKKVAKTDPRNVTFTTPLRCSPRLAKVGETCDGSSSATPTPKKDMRDHLQQWLIEKGKTPSRFSNLLSLQKNTPADRIRRERLKARRPTPARHIQPAVNEGGDISLTSAHKEAMEKLDATLAECLSLLHEGCPVDHVTHWLDDICRRLPMVEQCAKYWLCRATATEIDGDYDDVIGVFEEAAEAEAQPVDEIKEGLKELVMRMAEKGKTSKDGSYPSILKTPRIESASHDDIVHQTTPEFSPSTPSRSHEATPVSLEQATPQASKLMSHGLAHHSGVKYCLTDTTPLFKRTEATPYFTPGLVITPVRRSVRLESRRSFLPDSLKDHDICVNSLEDLPENTPSEFILRSNRALEGEFTDDDDV